MKVLLILFFASSFFSNIVASYHNRHQGELQDDWSQDQRYSQNPNSGFLLQPATTNYAPPQQVPNYQQTPFNYEQFQQETYGKTLQHQNIEISEQSRDEQLTIPLQQPYRDVHTQNFAQLDRNYDSYGEPQSWSNAPPNRVYGLNSYPTQHVQSSWAAQNSYPSAIISQDPYPSRPAYWQPKGYQNVPPPYYGGPYEGQVVYNNQAQVPPSVVLVPTPPQPMPLPQPHHRTQHPSLGPAPQMETESEPQVLTEYLEKNNVRETIAWKPEVKDILESTKKRLQQLHPNSKVQHINNFKINSQYFKYNDSFIEQDKIKNNNEGSDNKKINTVHKHIQFSTPLPDTIYENQNRNSEPINNNDTPPQLNSSQDADPPNWPIKEEPLKKFNPRFNLYKHKKTLWSENTNSPEDKSDANNNYYNPPNDQPHKLNNNNMDWNNSPTIEQNRPQKPIAEIFFIEKDSENEKKHEPVFNLDKERVNKFPLPDKDNFENSSNMPSAKPFEINNFYRNPTFSPPQPAHPKYPIKKHPVPHPPPNEHGHHQHHPINKHSDNSAPINEQNVHQNPSGINYPHVNPVNFEPKNSETIPAMYMTTEASDGLVEDTEKPYPFTGPSFKPNNNSETFALPPSKNYADFISDLNDQAQPSAVLDTNDETSSIVKSYPGNENPTSEKYTDDGFTSNQFVVENDDIVSDEDEGEDKAEIPNDSYPASYDIGTTYSEGNLSPISDDNTEDLLNEGNPADDDITADQDQTEQKANFKDVESNTEQQETGGNEVVVADLEALKNVDKPVFWYRPTEEFWDKLYSEADTGGYDRLFIFNVKVVDPIIEKSSKSYVFENGTTMEEITEIHWDNEADELPREIRISKIIKNPGPEIELPTRSRFKQVPDSTEAPKCIE